MKATLLLMMRASMQTICSRRVNLTRLLTVTLMRFSRRESTKEKVKILDLPNARAHRHLGQALMPESCGLDVKARKWMTLETCET